MKKLLALALLVSGCGGTGADLPDGAGESYQRWREDVERVCKDLRARVEDLPDPNEEAEGGSDAERLRALGEATRPIAALYVEAARATRAIPLPAERGDAARRYVKAFEDRAENYAAIAPVAARADREGTTELTGRDETLSRGLALATEGAGVRC